ncbi:DNA N-6-adenine-methyltransferase [Stenotrophomonas maltophilia]|uniref:DNA N-6-adenine-methyltransferase n=1 Tax=Stenotrophomonas maltophilia TaxID=40324 RepID=UPI00066D6635|nr:DNA N-6-adenine-methyltransferase [Stenotrophomonas maltophilia]
MNKANYANAIKTTTTWLTPKRIIDALGPFDLDPCTPVEGMPWATAEEMWTPVDDGLETPWPNDKFVWHNPPYGRGQEIWMEKAAEHGNNITLVFARTDTKWMHRFVFNHWKCRAVLFTEGRLKFCNSTGIEGQASPAGSVFIAYGKTAEKRLRKAWLNGDIDGHFLSLNRMTQIPIDLNL